LSIVAIVAYSDIAAANAALEEAGFGPQNFTVPAYTGIAPSHAALHCWNDPRFQEALEALPYVTIQTEDGEPASLVNTLIEAQGAKWPAKAPELPNTGMVNAGEMYRYQGKGWSIIQAFDRSTFGAPPETYPALMRYVRQPGSIEEWKQPIDQYDAYKLVNLYTGAPDQCKHNGQIWKVIQADGAGNNVYEPGVFGWEVVL
jgi:hypothetical protein